MGNVGAGGGCFGCTGRMAAPGAESLEFLTRRHGVKIDVTASIEECSLAVSAVVGHENVLSASRMNNAIVLFVKTIELPNFFYMVLKDNVEELDLTQNFRHEEFNYVIYATTNTMRCFGCSENGHCIRGCPKREENINKTASTVASGNVIEVQEEIATVVEEMPGTSTASVAPKKAEKVSEILEKEIVGKVSVAVAGEEEVIVSQRIEQAGCDSDDGSNSEDEAMINPEDRGSVLGDGECFFKPPKKGSCWNALLIKKQKD